MSLWKDQWIAAYEDRCSELEEQGVHPELAAELAEQETDGIARDRLADLADHLRQRAKDAGL